MEAMDDNSKSFADGLAYLLQEGAADVAVHTDDDVVSAAMVLASMSEEVADVSSSVSSESEVSATEACAECGSDFPTFGLVWRVDYNTCGTCSVPICPTCYAGTDPIGNGKFCGCCGCWHCDMCFEEHEKSMGYVDW